MMFYNTINLFKVTENIH